MDILTKDDTFNFTTFEDDGIKFIARVKNNLEKFKESGAYPYQLGLQQEYMSLSMVFLQKKKMNSY